MTMSHYERRELIRRRDECLSEMTAYIDGERSTTNSFMDAEARPEDRTFTLAMVEVADAAAVVKLAAAVYAYDCVIVNHAP